MNINATLVIQAINFCIAYVILRKLLFEPAIQAIAKEEAVLADMRQAIFHDQQFIAAKQESLRQQWQNSHEFCEQNKPEVLHTSIIQNISPILEVKPVNPEHAQACVTEIAHIMSDKIGRL